MTTVVSEVRHWMEKPWRRASRRSEKRSKALRSAITAVGATMLGLALGFLLIVRFKPRRLLRGVRNFNKRVVNPAMLRLAGRRNFYAATVHHVGRRTGQHYVTPVVVDSTVGGFVIPLPYGHDVDWLKNVLASGGCTIDYHGQVYNCGEPTVVRADEARTLVHPSRQKAWQVIGIDQVLLLKQATTLPTVNPPTV